MELQIIKQIPEQRIADLLVGAFEGGSNYWMSLKGYKNKKPAKNKDDALLYQPSWLATVLSEDGVLILNDDDAGSNELELTRAKLVQGLKVMEAKYFQHYSNFINENDDAETSDVFLQCCVFGEIVYR